VEGGKEEREAKTSKVNMFRGEWNESEINEAES